MFEVEGTFINVRYVVRVGPVRTNNTMQQSLFSVHFPGGDEFKCVYRTEQEANEARDRLVTEVQAASR